VVRSIFLLGIASNACQAMDESYFGGRRKGKRGRGSSGKVPVFGLLKRNGYVHAMLIPNAASATLVPIIREKIRPHSIVYTDSFRAYDVLDVSEFHHYRINHSKLFAEKNNHINRCLADDVYIVEKGY
jgi:transposase